MEQAMRNEERARALRISALMDRKPPNRPKALQTYFSIGRTSKIGRDARRASADLKRA